MASVADTALNHHSLTQPSGGVGAKQAVWTMVNQYNGIVVHVTPGVLSRGEILGIQEGNESV